MSIALAGGIGPGLCGHQTDIWCGRPAQPQAFAQVDKKEIGKVVEAHPEIRRWFHTLDMRLVQNHFHFGYRVSDEIAQFIYNANRNGMFAVDPADTSMAWLVALDHAVYMKVLSKFNGSHARPQRPLTTLIEWAKDPENLLEQCADAGNRSEDETEAGRSSPTPANANLIRVVTRANQMLKTLETNGFVSFGYAQARAGAELPDRTRFELGSVKSPFVAKPF